MKRSTQKSAPEKHLRRPSAGPLLEGTSYGSITEVFEEQVRRSPSAVALECGGRKTTYRDLNLRSNRLAHYLKKLGVTSETPVALCVRRSAKMVIGMLGILKAGGFYVPLDPSYPASRLEFMLKDSDARILVTEQALLESLPQNEEVAAVCLDRHRSGIGSPATPTLQKVAKATTLPI